MQETFFVFNHNSRKCVNENTKYLSTANVDAVKTKKKRKNLIFHTRRSRREGEVSETYLCLFGYLARLREKAQTFCNCCLATTSGAKYFPAKAS